MGYQPRAKPDFRLLQGARVYDYQPTQPEPEQNPPQSVSGIIPWEKYLRPEQALQDYEQIIEHLHDATNTWHSTGALRFVDWDMYDVWLKYAEALRQVAFGERDLLSPLEDIRALEWGIRAGIISPDEARIHYGYSESEPPKWGVTAQEFVNAFTGYRPAEPIGDSSDGIAPCGYDDL